ncbi:hypothetical protein [Streptomyces sp. NPDC051219]
MLTRINHLRLCTKEISHTGEQPDSPSRPFTHPFPHRRALGLDHALS